MGVPSQPPAAEDKLVRELHMGAGTRVWVAEDVEEYRSDQLFLKRIRGTWDSIDATADRDYLRLRRVVNAEWRDKWGKFKVAALIATVGAVVSLVLPHLWKIMVP